MPISLKNFRHQDENPFYYIATEIPDKYFCDRDAETKKIISLIQNKNNIVLKAPRRLGKSSLIHHVFKQKDIKDRYNAIYMDIYSTRTSEDFINLMFKSISECPTVKGKILLQNMERKLKEITYEMQISIPKILTLSSTQKYDVLKVNKALDVVFDFLSCTNRPNLIVIDEFQQIQQYDDCNIEPLLRTFIQKSANTCFIFSGSSKHLLTQMFESPDKPFYRSCRTMNLDIIPKDIYMTFCRNQFEQNGKHIDKDCIELIYDIFQGNTFSMQQTMNELYHVIAKGETACREDAKNVIESIVDEKADDYRTYLHSLKPMYEKVLLRIAKDVLADNLTSEVERSKHNLPASSTVSNILKYFTDDKNRIVEEPVPDMFRLEDTFMELWAAKYVFNNLQSRFENANAIFKTELELKKKVIPKTKRTSKKP